MRETSKTIINSYYDSALFASLMQVKINQKENTSIILSDLKYALSNTADLRSQKCLVKKFTPSGTEIKGFDSIRFEQNLSVKGVITVVEVHVFTPFS